jgi:hypothetical protein
MNIDYLAELVLPTHYLDMAPSNEVQDTLIENAATKIDKIIELFTVFYDNIYIARRYRDKYTPYQLSCISRCASAVVWESPRIRVGVTLSGLNARINKDKFRFTEDHVLGRKFIGELGVQLALNDSIDDTTLYHTLYDLYIEGLKVVWCTTQQNKDVTKFQGLSIDPYQQAHVKGYDVCYIPYTNPFVITKHKADDLLEMAMLNRINVSTSTVDIINWEIMSSVISTLN